MSEPPAAEAAAPPGVPGYLLETLLGRGGTGEVWRAVPRGGGPAVAIKVLVAGDPGRQAREAALLGELDHPHLVRLHEVVHQPRRGGAARVALVLDLLAGGSLGDLIARRGRLRPGEVVTAVAPVAAALAHAHDRGIVHGDLSPGNIVFTAEGRPVLTDLGVARVLGEAGGEEITPAYVDPTVARGGAAGPASDVFGLAAAAFHALTGVAPWNGGGPSETLAVAAGGLLPDLDELAPEAPAALRAVIGRGLSPAPHERGSAAAFALDLRHACRPEPVRLPAPGTGQAELRGAGGGSRTELTHQVPGRRPRPAPVVVVSPAGARLRRAAVAAALCVSRSPLGAGLPRGLVAAGLVGAALTSTVWIGVRWGTPQDADGGAVTAVTAVSAAAEERPPAGHPRPAPTPEGSTGSAPEPAPGSGAEARSPGDGPDAAAVTAGSRVGWRHVVNRLYARRADAFTSGSPAPLDDVYTDASPLRAADEAYLTELTDAGEVLRGYAPVVLQVEAVDGDDARVVLRLTDGWPGFEVVPARDPGGPAVRTLVARGRAEVRMVLRDTAAGWRIDRAERVP